METFKHEEAGEVSVYQLSDKRWWCGGQIAPTKDQAIQRFCDVWHSTITNWDVPPYMYDGNS